MLVNFFIETLSSQAKARLRAERFMLDRIAVVILAGGQGERLLPLTKNRCKPAISFGGRYSLIDIPISHSLNSGLKNIFVIAQYLTNGLQKHLFQAYLNQGISQKELQMLVPEERNGEKIWYKGTADAIRQNLEYFNETPADYFLILSGDQLYNMDFRNMIEFALETDADLVIAAQPVNEKNAKRMGLLRIDHATTRVIDFAEKPQDKEVLERYFADEDSLRRMGYEPHKGKNYLGSMGIYFFKKKALFDLLREDIREDFGKHLIASQMKRGDVRAFLYDGYWEDIGTIESYYEANLALTRNRDDFKRGLQCYDESHLIRTRPYHLPGAKILNTIVNSSIICEGCVIEAEEISHSIIGVRSIIKKGTVIRDSILMGNEFYERGALSEREHEQHPSIGENCLIVKTIIDENVTVGKNVQLVNLEHRNHFDSSEGAPKLHVRDGIIIVPRGTHLPDNFVF